MRSIVHLGFVSMFITLSLFLAPHSNAHSSSLFQPVPTPTPTVRPVVTPAVTPSPVQTKPTGQAQTLADLQNRIRMELSRPELRRGMVGIKVLTMNSGK